MKFLTVVVGMTMFAAGCGSSADVCSQLKAGMSSYATKAAACSDAASSVTLDTSTCDDAKCNSDDEKAAKAFADCMKALTACTTDTAMTFLLDSAGCMLKLGTMKCSG